MDEVNAVTQVDGLADWRACAEQLAGAAAGLEKVLEKLEAQYEALNQKIDRIIAAVEKVEAEHDGEAISAAARVNELERENEQLRGQVVHASRRTLPSTVTRLLAKSGVGEIGTVESECLDKALGSLSVEQRIAVKAELLRAGLIRAEE